MTTSKPTGIRRRHARTCRSQKCACPWEAFVYDKREKKKHRKVFATQAEAKSWRADKQIAADRGKLRAATKMTVRQAADEFLAGARDGSIRTSARRPYKPATIRSYDEALRLRVLPKLGHMRLSDVQRADVQDLADGLDGMSASTIQNTIDPLRVIYRRAIRRDLVTVDPTEHLDLARPDGRRDRIASPTEAAELLDALDEKDRALWATAFYTGLRRGELRALRCSDIDLAARVIHVRRGWDAVEGEQEGKSAAARRDVPILDPLLPILSDHVKGGDRVGDALVFGRTPTEPFVPSTVRARALATWKAENARRVKAADGRENVDLLAPITLHEARHTCASVLIEANVNAKALSVIMGHATITMTFDTYGHLMPNGIGDAAAAANAYLARNAGGPALSVVGA